MGQFVNVVNGASRPLTVPVPLMFARINIKSRIFIDYIFVKNGSSQLSTMSRTKNGRSASLSVYSQTAWIRPGLEILYTG